MDPDKRSLSFCNQLYAFIKDEKQAQVDYLHFSEFAESLGITGYPYISIRADEINHEDVLKAIYKRRCGTVQTEL